MHFTEGLKGLFNKSLRFNDIGEMLRKYRRDSLPRGSLLRPLKRLSELNSRLQELTQFSVPQSGIHQPRIVMRMKEPINIHTLKG